MAELWVDRRSEEYTNARQRREYARDHYTGEALEKSSPATKRVHTSIKDSRAAVVLYDSRMREKYLHKRSQGEADDAYDERAKISRYPNHMATLVDSFVGGVFSVEDKIERVWSPGLGSHEEPGTVAARLWTDIDGSGTNWLTRLIQKTADLIVDEEVWYYADAATGRVRIFDIDPDRVVQWREEEGRLVEVLVEEFWEEQATLMDEPVSRHDYIHYTLEGWTRYRENVNERGDRWLQEIDGKPWKFPFWDSADKKYRRLPIGRVKIPVRRPLGYQMARDANALYNMLSDARWLYRVMNYPRLRGKVTDDEWEKTKEAIRQGMNALQGDWEYISPPSENASSVYSDYRHEVREFYISNHQRANQVAIERSATEILYNEAAGRTAFLTLLSQTVDEMENDWLSLAAQLEYPESPDEWRGTRVRRSRDFRPVDAEMAGDRMSQRFATYVNHLPVELALALSGHPEDDIKAYRTFDPAPEEDFFNESEEEPQEPILV